MVAVAGGLSTLLLSGRLLPHYLASTYLPSLLSFLGTGCRQWAEAKKQVHAAVLISLVDSLRSLVLALDSL